MTWQYKSGARNEKSILLVVAWLVLRKVENEEISY